MIILSLKAARVNCNLTLIQAAEALNITKDTLSRYERDSTNIPRHISKKMEILYKIPEKYLYFGKLSDFKFTGISI